MASPTTPEADETLRVPTKEEVSRLCQENDSWLNYVKLHGSKNWRSGDGQDVMVIGHRKADSINDEPILSAYREMFRRVLGEESTRLCVVGYSFRDIHINRVIAEAVKERELSLCVVNPESPRSIRDHLMSSDDGEVIWYYGVTGYFPCPFEEIFPSHEAGLTERAKELRRVLGEGDDS